MASIDDVRGLIELATRVYAAPGLVGYVVDLIEATRDHPDVRLGASTRAVVAMTRALRAWALLAGRSFVVPEDVKALARPVLAHRLLLGADAELRGATGASVIDELTTAIAIPSAG